MNESSGKGAARRSQGRGWHVWLELARIPNLPSVWGNVIAGAAVTLGWAALRGEKIQETGSVTAALAAELWGHGLGHALLAGTLMYLAGMFLNDARDAGWDRRHRPTRPIPSGRVREATVWWIGGSCLAAGLFSGLMVPGGRWIAVGLALAVAGYTWLHKVWAGSVILMGLCRALSVLLGAACAVPLVAGAEGGGSWWPAVAAALAQGGYVAGLTIMARTEAISGRVPVTAWVLLLTPLAWALGLFAVSGAAWVLMGLIALSGWIVWVRRCRRRDGVSGTGAAVGRLLAGMSLVDSIAVALLSPVLAVLYLVAAPVFRWLQRRVAAT